MVNEKESPKFFDNLLFPKVFKAFRMSIQPSKLIIAFLAAAVIYATGWIMDIIAVSALDSQDKVFFTLWGSAVERFHSASESLLALNIFGVYQNISSYLAIVGDTFKDHYIYLSIFLVIKLVVISLAGGAICRIAALQFARGEKPGMNEVLRFSTKKFTSFFSAPLAPWGIIIFIGFFIFLLGLFGNIPWAGKPIMVIFMFLALFASGLITVVLIGAIAGLNLMFPAVAYDDSDCFDAISRSFSYIFAKPWRMGFYTFIAAIYGSICYLFVRFFAFLTLWVTRWFLQLGVLGDDSKLTEIWQHNPTFSQLIATPNWSTLNESNSVAAFLVYLLLLAVAGLVVAFIVSFYFSANTIIYSLMRKMVDNTALEDVHTPAEETMTEPTTAQSEQEKEQKESNSKM
jgi:hypothetical protein